MIKYLIIHNKHDGCYDFQCYQDEFEKIRLTSIRINPPKIFMFDKREEAQDFFEDYINDVDCIDNRCRKGEDVEHVEYCTCGVIEVDNKHKPILFYNKRNQIFLMENGPQVFIPNQELKNDINNLNLTNRLIRKCKSLPYEIRKTYIELGQCCEKYNIDDENEDNEQNDKVNENDKKSNDSNEDISTNNNITINLDVCQEIIKTEKELEKNKEKKKRTLKKTKEQKDKNKINL